MAAQFYAWVSSRFPRKCPGLFLAFWWILGLVCGWELFRISGFTGRFTVADLSVSSASAVDLLIRALIPFLICAVGILLDQRWIIYGCAFGKAMTMCFASLWMLSCFGSGGWLVRVFLLFTDTLMCGIWYGFWMDALSGNQLDIPRFLLFCAGGCLIAGVDLRVISPLVMRIMNV